MTMHCVVHFILMDFEGNTAKLQEYLQVRTCLKSVRLAVLEL